MIQLSEFLAPRPEPMWNLIRQAGVDNVIATLNGGEQDQRMFASVGKDGYVGSAADDVPWSEAALRRDVEIFANHGMTVIGIEDTAPMDKIRLGLPGRDEEIDHVITQIKAMGRLQLRTLCYNWMALSSWGRTDTEVEVRGGALVTGFRLADTEDMAPLVAAGEVAEQQMWDALQYFLDAVVPVAEEAGVRLGMHPDDPPRAIDRNLPRLMRSPEAFRKLREMRPSINNGITFCQGNFALMEDADLPALIREFGVDGIAFVHFRDVIGTATDFRETFHDEGQTDLPECMRAYAEIGFSGPMRPDHVPTMYGESNARPGYETLGRLFAIGYIRGVEQAAYGRPPVR